MLGTNGPRSAVKYLDYMNGRLRKEANAKKTFIDINEAMNEYYVVTGGRFALPPNLREGPKLAVFTFLAKIQKL